MHPTPDGIRIGAAYIRVSTDDQVEYSPESQLVEIGKYEKTNSITEFC
ncbi:recombinase family protein [Intestinibacillus massiliensis]|nr:recombinase family protein [Intestinibacillus massiliensis]